MDDIESELSESQTSEIEKLLICFQNVFAGPDGQLGRTSVTKHRIVTTDPRPIKIPPRRLGWAKREIVNGEIDKMLANDVIEPSSSPYSFPILLVPKKDGSVRFCVDFRKLNNKTYKDSYPLPRISDILETLGGAQWFSSLDLASGFWQMEIEDSDREKTAFSVPGRGHFQFKVMPFGLCNAPSSFERMIENVLAKFLWKDCLSFLDDVLCFGGTFDSALQSVKNVLIAFSKAGLKLNPKKCKLFRRECSYLGYHISASGVSCDPSKTFAVTSWPVPKCLTDVRSFLGIVNYYRQFIENFAQVANPLICLTRKNTPFAWTDSCQWH